MTADVDRSFAATAQQPTASSAERERAFRRAARHSKLVRILRIACPACAVVIVGFYFLSSKFTISIGDMQASVARIEVNKDSLRMIEPRLEGVTDDKGSYFVTADFAEQDIKNTNIVRLNKVRAEIDNPKQGWTRLTAPEGKFDTRKELLLLTGDIRVSSSSGMTSRLTRAEIDMKSQRTVSNEPVIVKALNGTINSNTMEIFNAERTVIFRGDIRVHIFKRPVKKPDGENKQ